MAWKAVVWWQGAVVESRHSVCWRTPRTQQLSKDLWPSPCIAWIASKNCHDASKFSGYTCIRARRAARNAGAAPRLGPPLQLDVRRAAAAGFHGKARRSGNHTQSNGFGERGVDQAGKNAWAFRNVAPSLQTYRCARHAAAVSGSGAPAACAKTWRQR